MRPLVSYQEGFDAAPVGMLVVDGQGRIVDVNRQLERLFGYSKEELMGQPVERLVDSADTLHRQRRESYLSKPEARPMGAGRDLYGRHRNGHRIPVEIGLTPLRTESGTWVVASVVDLTERKRAEEQFRLAIEAAPNGMMLVDERGDIILVNAQIEQLFGYTREELIGQSVDRLLPERFRGSHGNSRRSFFSSPKARSMGAGRELYGLRKNGTEVPVEIGLSPLTTPAGQLVLSSIVDITERQQAREMLEASLREKEVLLKELHHRTKNNLQLISSLLDLAADSPSRDVLSECRDRIHSISLVHEKLYQAGTFARIDAADYLRSLGEHVAQSWAQEGVTLEVKCDAFTLPLDVAIPCGLIINELLTNSFRHAFPDGRTGTVTLRASGGPRITVSVEDNGIGLPPGEPRRPGHIGFDVIYALARQLRTELILKRGNGTNASLSFEEGVK